MTEKVLFVDDEPNILDAIRRQIGRHFTMDVAGSGADGIQLIERMGPYAVVVSDMRMPGMSGSQFLARVRELCPDTVRIILSGQSDIAATIEAVNEGQLYRFLTKPCSTDILSSAVESGLRQYRLVNAEKELLEKTLSGAVQMLTEIVGLTNPVAYSRATRIHRYAKAIAEAMEVGNDWQLNLAAMFSQIGCITLPAEVLSKVYAGTKLSPDEQRLYQSHPEVAAKLLGNIPRLEVVADIVAGQLTRPDLSGVAPMANRWDTKTLGIVVLSTATLLDQLVTGGTPPAVALYKLVEAWPQLPKAISDRLRQLRFADGDVSIRSIGVAELVPGMILDEDLKSRNGIRLVPQGHEVTNAIIIRLGSVAERVGVCEPFRVRVTT